MKKTLALLLSLVFILTACSQQNNTGKSNDKDGQFKNNTLELSKGSVTITDVHIMNNKDDGTKNIVFLYEINNISAEDKITSLNAWIDIMKAYQDSKNTVNELKVGSTPLTGQYKPYFDHMLDAIKKGGTAKGVAAYVLQNDEPVVLKAHNPDQTVIGKKTYNLKELKTVDYSYVEDYQKENDQIYGELQ